MPADVPLTRRRFAAGRSIFALIVREMVTTYGRSPGGYLWAILEPVAAIALLSFAFSLAFRAPSLGESFPLFYATGYLPYMLFHDVSMKTANSIRFSRPLLSFSAVTFLDLILARFLLNTLTHLLVMFLVIGGLMLIFDTRAVIDPAPILLGLCMAASLAIGVGTMNCFLFNAFPAWEQIWAVATRPLFIISGVFFILEDIPALYRDVLWFNPLFHATGAVREGFYATYDASYLSSVYVFSISIVLFVIGLMLLRRYHDDLVHT